MDDQIRTPAQIIGKPDTSALKLDRQTEQRLIREWRSPFPELPVRFEDSALRMTTAK
ncbi:hypothetical protein [Neorhizobium sp. NCHU2750]|uniref:hypothetical protein n=1 Tax=Neorhizobium sp. NCHU2750 TaxID=1825976 RepID=UPI0013C51299